MAKWITKTLTRHVTFFKKITSDADTERLPSLAEVERNKTARILDPPDMVRSSDRTQIFALLPDEAGVLPVERVETEMNTTKPKITSDQSKNVAINECILEPIAY